MPRFIRLVKFTPEGKKNLKEFPERFQQGRQFLESLGGKIVDIYAVSGPYDIVGVIEASEEAAMKHAVFISQTGYAELLTMPAMPLKEFVKLVGDVPKP